MLKHTLLSITPLLLLSASAIADTPNKVKNWVGGVDHLGLTVSPAIVTQAFKMAHPADSAVVDIVDLNNGDSAIVALKSVTDAQVAENIDAQTKQTITMAQANKNYMVFIEALKAQAELNLPLVGQAAE